MPGGHRLVCCLCFTLVLRALTNRLHLHVRRRQTGVAIHRGVRMGVFPALNVSTALFDSPKWTHPTHNCYQQTSSSLLASKPFSSQHPPPKPPDTSDSPNTSASATRVMSMYCSVSPLTVSFLVTFFLMSATVSTLLAAWPSGRLSHTAGTTATIENVIFQAEN